MKARLILCILLFTICLNCVSRKIALKQSNDVPENNTALCNAAHAVALIISTSANYTPLKLSDASNGILISEDGYILTISHGLSYNIPIVYIDDERYGAEIVYNNKKYDFAILKITALHPLPFLRFAPETKQRQNAYLLGKFRKNRESFMSKGTLEAKSQSKNSKEMAWGSATIGQKLKVDYAIQNGILHSARFFEGLSGCPLLDESGNVIGMNSGGMGSEERRVTLAPDMIGFLPAIEHASEMQIPQTDADTVDLALALNDPVKRMDWVIKGLAQYASLLGKDSKHIEELSSRVEKQATEKLKTDKSQEISTTQWVWKTFLTEIYGTK
jgi:hypothetical protein